MILLLAFTKALFFTSFVIGMGCFIITLIVPEKMEFPDTLKWTFGLSILAWLFTGFLWFFLP